MVELAQILATEVKQYKLAEEEDTEEHPDDANNEGEKEVEKRGRKG